MTLAEAGEIFAYWAVNPPLNLMVQTIARMLGWKPAERRPPSADEIAAAGLPGLFVVPAGRLGMPAPELDIETLRTRNRARLAIAADKM